MKSTPLTPVEPSATYDPGVLLMEDLTVLLVACGAAPIRLRTSTSHLLAKDARKLGTNLNQFPDWLESNLFINVEARLQLATVYCRTFKLATFEGIPPVMRVTETGKTWLALSAGDRARVLADGVLDRKQAVREFANFKGADIGTSCGYFGIECNGKRRDCHDGILDVLRTLNNDEFYAVPRIEEHCQSQINPLTAALHAHPPGAIYWYDAPLPFKTEEELRRFWSHAVVETIWSRLLPLGGVRVGRIKGGLAIAISEIGRYYLGQLQEWPWLASPAVKQIVVQSNFDVYFAGESPAAEAEVARVAERRRGDQGGLFRITRRSISLAAGGGMTADEAMAILTRVCTRPVPQNVERDIREWFAQCRPVVFQNATLIRCPDAETAARVAAAAQSKVERLTGTVLECKASDKERQVLIKKLKSAGLLVSVDEPSPPKEQPPRIWIKRRRW